MTIDFVPTEFLLMKNKKTTLISISILLIAIAAFVLWLQSTQRLGKVSSIIGEINVGWGILALGCMFVYLIFEMIALNRTLKLSNIRIPKRRIVSTTMLGLFFGNLTPSSSGAQPAQAASLAVGGISLGRSASALLSKFIIFQAVVTLIAAIMLVFNIAFFKESFGNIALLAIVGFVVHFFVLLLLLAAGLFPKWISTLGNKSINVLKNFHVIKHPGNARQKMEHEIDKFAHSFKSLQNHKINLLIIAILTAIELIAMYSVPFFVICALGNTDANYINVLAATSFVNLIATSIPLPGGTGGAEGSFLLFFKPFVIGENTTFAALIIWRFITYYLPIILGAPFITDLKPKKKIK
ncbi:MAG: lysylphosphatidylglycerol synthase transmembrane domain-containing protein [Coriobacteriia bacterium]|nr:lysylphosphatidylglycerol synthase transmembrane domain-containing protein [Coriobacteriia bacterium]